MKRMADTTWLSKLAYSIVLLAVLWIFVKELHRVWFDRQTYMAHLAYFADGKADAAKATAFGGATVEAAVSWPLAPSSDATGISPLRYFSTARQPSDEEASAIIAANLLWGSLSAKEQAIRNVPRDEFVRWLLAWEKYRSVRELRVTPSQLNVEQKKVLEAAGAQISDLLLRGPEFAEVWRLAANLVAQHPQSIAGSNNPWEYYRDGYEVAIGKRSPSTRASPLALTLPSDRIVPGSLLWRDDGRFAVKVTAVVRDASGKRFLLLSSLLVDSTKGTLPIDLFGSEDQSKGRAPVARAVEQVPLDPQDQQSATVLLAELLPGIAAGNAGVRGAGTPPALGQRLTVVGGDRSGAVSVIDVHSPLGNGLIAVEPRVTSAGDAGIAFVDAQQRLVAMGYAGSERTSLLVPLPALLLARKLDVE